MSKPAKPAKRTDAAIFDASKARRAVIRPSTGGFGTSIPHSPRTPSRPPIITDRLSIHSSSSIVAAVKPLSKPAAYRNGKKAVPKGRRPSSITSNGDAA
ncbi:MAG: hypothetical protein EAZ65_02795 [Verrucomicrobia bacterium]|nr:MAG: hypothetical protein EAZ65_02795 [Verrucomicrobiota bacterium]